MAVPYTFGSATSSIPLSQLDSNFATGITLGNTTVYLGNTTTSFGNVTLTNVTISSVAAAITPSQGGTGLVTIPANNVILGNGTSNVTVVAPGTSGNVLTSNGTTWSSSTISAASVSAAGSTTQVQYNNGGAFAGSANLTFNGTTLTAAGLSGPLNGTVGATTPSTGAFTTLSASSTVSGTGFSTYLASPPAIGGTAAAAGSFTTLSASSDLTLSGGTANGVTYLNGSKVLTSGSALTFDGTNLTAVGSLIAQRTGGVSQYARISNTGGTATFISDNQASSAYTGFVFQGLSTASGTPVDYLNLTSTSLYTASGINVGIGTSSPQRKLSIANGGPVVEIDPAGISGTDPIYFNYNRSTSTYLTPQYWALAHNWRVSGGTSAMTLDSAGNLGLGVTPSTWSEGRAIERRFAGTADWGYLQAESYRTTNAYFNGGWKYGGTGAACKYGQVGGTHEWSTAASGTAGNAISFTQAMTLDASGNLGVGLTDPASYSSKLVVAGHISATAGNKLKLWDSANTSLVGIACPATNVMAFYTADAGTERARIDSSGNLLVGGTTSVTARLQAFSPNTSTGAISAISQNSGDVGQEVLGCRKYDNNTTTSQVFQRFVINNGVTGSGQINANGANAAAFGSFSDKRLKENIIDLPPQLEKIVALRPVEFDYIESEGGGHQIGFIAQEMQDVYPDAVGIRQPDEMLTVTGWDKTTARLVKAIQEQQAIIQQLQADVAALKG